jgi:hypothetical protein
MVKLVGSNSGEFGAKLVENEIISLIPISVAGNHGMTKVHSTRE